MVVQTTRSTLFTKIKIARLRGGGYVKIPGSLWTPTTYVQSGITTLSGNLSFTESDDSAYHIFLTHNLTSASEFTRLKFTGAKADGMDTTFFSGQNYYSQFGGGLYNISSDPILNLHNGGTLFSANFGFVTFVGNQSTGDAAGMYNTKSSPILNAVYFKDNRSDRDGGGLYNKDQSDPEINFCIFENNYAGNYGGGMINNNSCNPEISKTLFEDNYAGKRGGGLYNWSSCNPDMINNAFESNESGQVGGAMASYQSSPEITNAVFYNNTAEYRGAIASTYQCGSKITNATFFDNEATKTDGGGALYAVTSWPTINNSAFYDNDNKDLRNVSSFVLGTHNASDYGASSVVNLGSGFVNLSGWDDDEVFGNPSDPSGFLPTGYFDLGAGLTPSACGPLVDAGTNSEIPSGVTNEMRNAFLVIPLPRIAGDIVDIGAYEMHIESDCEIPTAPGVHTSTDIVEQGGIS